MRLEDPAMGVCCRWFQSCRFTLPQMGHGAEMGKQSVSAHMSVFACSDVRIPLFFRCFSTQG